MGRKFDPALCRIGHYVHFPECLGLRQEIVSHVVKLGESFLQSRRELKVWLVDEVLVGREERRAQDGVVPVKNDTRLTGLGFILLSQPNLVIGESRKELVTDLLISPRRRPQVRLVLRGGVENFSLLSVESRASH